jgi:hypothetical protein
MKKVIPGRVELSVLFVLAMICTAVVACCSAVDVAMAGMSVPLFLTGALLGLRKNAKLQALRVPVAVEVTSEQSELA